MKYYKGQLTEREIIEIADDIRIGKIVVFPTETVYGIGTNACHEQGCKRIYQIKKRPNEKALIVLISNYEQLQKLVKTPNQIEKQLMKAFWPGPLTIVFQKGEDNNLSKVISADLDTIGIRMTDGEFIRKLLQISNVPIVAPSANLSGKSDGSRIDIIIDELGNEVDDIVDVGDIVSPVPSTIVQVVNEKIEILREGKIKKESLLKIAEIK